MQRGSFDTLKFKLSQSLWVLSCWYQGKYVIWYIASQSMVIFFITYSLCYTRFLFVWCKKLETTTDAVWLRKIIMNVITLKSRKVYLDEILPGYIFGLNLASESWVTIVIFDSRNFILNKFGHLLWLITAKLKFSPASTFRLITPYHDETCISYLYLA
jgi:hypothetical protein